MECIREASDLFKMVHCMFEEGRSILDYIQNQGFKKVVTTGFSMEESIRYDKFSA